MFGFLNLNKPGGMTSHDCVAKVRRILQLKRVGHGGTLDPAATGVLPIAVGKATRLLQFLPENKAYEARIRFGVRTTTDDLEGEIIATSPAGELTCEMVKTLLSQFQGTIEQVPPVYSAIQRGGKRLYELARAVDSVEVPVRTVRVSKIDVLAWYPGEFPEISVAIACGSGTYIRAIARDLGAAAGVGGTLAALTRTESCGMKLADSLTFEQLGSHSLIAPNMALQHLNVVTLKDEDARRWCQGQKIAISANQQLSDSLKVCSEDGRFLGMGKVTNLSSTTLLIPKVVF